MADDWSLAAIVRNLVRTRVLWFGAPPSSDIESELDNRDLVVTPVTEASGADFASSRAAIFNYDNKNVGVFSGTVVAAPLKEMVDHGLLVVFICPDETAVKLVQSKIPTALNIEEHVFFRPFGSTAAATAEFVRRHDPQVAYNKDLIIAGDAPDDEHELLLRRAFSDSTKITLERLHGGLSGAHVYVVHAIFPPEAGGGSLPLPFFAKLDKVDRVKQEFDAYRQYVTNFVPFSQRPNLDSARCLFGVSEGILVGDFVENSVSLTSIMRTPARRSVIHSLFDDALRGWRRQGFGADTPDSPTSVLAFFEEDLPRWRNMHADVLRAAAALGCTESPEDLLNRLERNSMLNYRIGPVHGDLNTENVRARNGEAVLIDFYKTTRGPLVGDLVALEVAAAFKGIIQFVQTRKLSEQTSLIAEWRSEIGKLYCRGCLESVPPPHEEPARFGWLWDTCRELRLIARAIDNNCLQYSYCLVAYMIRDAAWYHSSPSLAAAQIFGESYATASRLLTDLSHLAKAP